MRRPDQPALTDAATGRVSMPFLPTLVVVAILGMASLYCPSSRPVLPASLTESVGPVDPLSAPSPTDFAPAAALVSQPGRLPASLAFAEAYPLEAPAVKPVAAPVRMAAPARPLPHFAAASRRACPGRRCPEVPQRVTDPLAAAHAEASEPADDQIIPRQALPFTDTVAETLAPAVRAVGDAANLVRTGATAVRGSVVLAVADCLR